MSEVMKCPKCGGEMESGCMDIRHAAGICELRFTRDKPSLWTARGICWYTDMGA